MEERGCRWLSQPLFSLVELLFTIWDLASLNKQAPYSLTTHIQSFMEKGEKSAFLMPLEHWMAMRALRLCLIHIV